MIAFVCALHLTGPITGNTNLPLEALSKQFTYEAFLDSLSTFLNDHIDSIRTQGTGKVETTAPTEVIAQDEHFGQGLDEAFDLNAMIAEASRAAQSALEPTGDTSHELDDLSAFLAENVSKAVEQAKESATNTELPSAIASAAESASRATMLALQSIQQNQYQPTALPQPAGKLYDLNGERDCSLLLVAQTQQTPNHNNYQTQQAQQAQPQQQYYHYQQQHPAANGIPPYQTANDHLPPNQSDSTPALYERARQAAAARSSTHARREGSHSTRRPWGPEEEKALMMGLDMVKGPHWSQILSLFGPNGSISNILADRTQVQLKDKARNLKLFFLKTNSEMPYYLQCVTGELKTRAPTQAARKEAEEKARLNSEEQQAHVNGILTLANGLQNNTMPRHSPSAVAPRSATPNQPMPHPNSLPGTPRVSQPIQQSTPASAPLPRPVIPAPQPVSLPNLTSIAHQHTQSPSTSQADRQTNSATTAPTPTPPSITTTPAPVTSTPTTAQTVPAPIPPPAFSIEGNEPVKNEMSSIDAAVLGLTAALERENEREREIERQRERESVTTTTPPANLEQAAAPSTTSATPAATSVD
jgi:protein TBF1